MHKDERVRLAAKKLRKKWKSKGVETKRNLLSVATLERPTTDTELPTSSASSSAIIDTTILNDAVDLSNNDKSSLPVMKQLAELGSILTSFNGETFSKLLALMDLACMTLSLDQVVESRIITVVSEICDSRYVIYNCFIWF